MSNVVAAIIPLLVVLPLHVFLNLEVSCQHIICINLIRSKTAKKESAWHISTFSLLACFLVVFNLVDLITLVLSITCLTVSPTLGLSVLNKVLEYLPFLSYINRYLDCCSFLNFLMLDPYLLCLHRSQHWKQACYYPHCSYLC